MGVQDADGAPELAPRYSDILGAVQWRFRVLAGLVGLNVAGIGAGVGLLVERMTYGAIAGGIAGIVLLVVTHEWGAKLDHKPRGLHLVKARTGAALLLLVVPLGTAVALPLLRRLRDPLLVKHAVANHPEYGTVSDEQLIATIRARSAFVTLRTTGILLLVLAPLLAFVALDVWKLWIVTAAAAIAGVVQLTAGISGLRKMQGGAADAGSRLRTLAWVVAALIPFGTYAAWSAHRLIAGERPPPA
jgi:hypothetical protein